MNARGSRDSATASTLQKVARRLTSPRSRRSSDSSAVTVIPPVPITTRFLVLTEGRTGSTLLVDELNRRWTEIRCLREVFRDDRLEGKHSFEKIKQKTFEDSTGEPIVGCKVFISQVDAEELSELLSMNALRVIILRRRNPLRRVLSQTIAENTSVWRQPVSQFEAPLPVQDRRLTLDVGRLGTQIAFSLSNFRAFEHLTREIPRIGIWYEDLSANLDRELRRVASFLGAGEPSVETPPKLIKQNPEPIRDLITNVDEVDAYLREVGLADLLEDERTSGVATPASPEPDTEPRTPCWPSESQRQLLRAFFGPAGSFQPRWRTWLEDTPLWDREARMEGLQAPIHHRLHEFNSPAIRLHDFRKLAMENVAMKMRLRQSMRNVVEQFCADGIDVILLGPTALLALSAEHVGSGFRTLTMTGLDLATRPEQFDSASAALLGCGWIATIADNPSPMNHPERMVTMHREGLEIRLHRTMLRTVFSDDSINGDGLEVSLRSGLIPAPQLEELATIPAPTELLFALIIDGLLARPARSISWILDTHHVLTEARQAIDWNRLAALTSETQLAAPMSAALHLLSELGEDLIPPTVLGMIDDIPVSDRQRTAFEEMMRTP